ncbi:hypothetical protein PMAYCL1PPCAC_22092, partial [Pristionchus mayeri]
LLLFLVVAVFAAVDKRTKTIGVKTYMKCGGVPLVAAQVAIFAKKLGKKKIEQLVTYGNTDATGKIKLSYTLPKELQQASDFVVQIKHFCRNGTLWSVSNSCPVHLKRKLPAKFVSRTGKVNNWFNIKYNKKIGDYRLGKFEEFACPY